jgi:hypothetical protein
MYVVKCKQFQLSEVSNKLQAGDTAKVARRLGAETESEAVCEN